MITGKDISTIMDLLVAAYGDKSYPTDPKQMAKVANLWNVMFRDDEPDEVLIAVKNCIATLSFPPKIADIKIRIAQNRLSGQMTEMEAWSAIREAVKSSDTRQNANQSFTELDPILQKVVGTPSQLRAWFMVSVDTFEGVIASNIQRSYRELAKHEITYYSLPKDLQASQKWMVGKPESVTMLPEPAPQKSIDEMQDDMDASAREYREKYGIFGNPNYKGKVADFQKPMSDSEQKMFEAKKRHDLKTKLDRMK